MKTDLDRELDSMDCPCPCEKCGRWFDLHDGDASEKWFPNTIICESCGTSEREEIERDEEIDGYKEMLENGQHDVKLAVDNLVRLGAMPAPVDTVQMMTEMRDVLQRTFDVLKLPGSEAFYRDRGIVQQIEKVLNKAKGK